MHKYSRQIVVIGAGAGGLYLTRILARLGYRVTMVDKANMLGGNCLHYSCVPSKAFIYCAQMAFNARNSTKYGVTCDPQISFAQIQAYIRNVVNQIHKNDNVAQFKAHGVDVIYGNAHFVGDHMLSVDDKLIPAEKFIIATGSQPSIPTITGLNKVKYYTTDNILTIKELPKRLVIIGAGHAAFEYAQAFGRLGTNVIVLESQSEFMPEFDRAQVSLLQASMADQNVVFYNKVNIDSVSQHDDETIIKVSSSLDKFPYNKNPISCDVLLIAAGRVGRVDNLGLELVGVEYNSNGIKVDDQLKTSSSHIFAIGDVIDTPYKLTHTAEYHAGIIIDNLAFKKHRRANYQSVPYVMYTDPGFAQVGLTEQAARAKKISFKTIEYPISKLDRAIINDQLDGNIKLLVKNGRILGASILSPHADELIHELVLVIKNKISLRKIKETIHAYPTWSQMHKRVIDKYYEPKMYGSMSKFYIKFRQWFE